MCLQEEIEAKLADKPVTKINGQPSNCDITKLKRELAKITSSVATDLEGGKHSHVEIILPEQ